MTPASQPHVVRLRSGDLVRVRQVRPGDASAVVSAYAHLGEQSRYRRFFAVMPELPEATVKAAVEVDHTDHEALVAVPLQSEEEIVGECRFVRLADQPDTADLAVTVVDAWQGRGLGSVLLARLSERALEVGIEYFTAEVLAENHAMLSLLPGLGRVESDRPAGRESLPLAWPGRVAVYVVAGAAGARRCPGSGRLAGPPAARTPPPTPPWPASPTRPGVRPPTRGRPARHVPRRRPRLRPAPRPGRRTRRVPPSPRRPARIRLHRLQHHRRPAPSPTAFFRAPDAPVPHRWLPCSQP